MAANPAILSNMKPSDEELRLDLRRFVEASRWYRALPAALRQLVLETAEEKTTPPGEYVARSGEPSSYWYGLIRGILQMYVIGADGGETTLCCLREGEWGGEGSLLKKELRRYDLKSLTPARICMLPASTFEVLRSSSIEFNQFLCNNMNDRMGEFVGMLAASRLSTPRMLVANAILMLSGRRVDERLELYVSQHELALICGLSRQRVNLAISELRYFGLVESEPRKGFLIVYAAQLRDFVEGKCVQRRMAE